MFFNTRGYRSLSHIGEICLGLGKKELRSSKDVWLDCSWEYPSDAGTAIAAATSVNATAGATAVAAAAAAATL